MIDFGYSDDFYRSLQALSCAPLVIVSFDDISRRSGVDALVCSWKDVLDRDRLGCFPDLIYIALRATSTRNIDLACVRERNISVAKISGYGDQATAEFVLQHLLRMARHQGQELSGKTVGFLGFGKVPQLISEPLKALGVRACYYTPSEEQQKRLRQKIPFAPKARLLQSDFVSVHSPAGIKSLSLEDLESLPPHSGLIVTTLGLPFEEEVLRAWKSRAPNHIVMDRVAAGHHNFSDLRDVEVVNVYAARTAESRKEAERQILEKAVNFSNNDFKLAFVFMALLTAFGVA